MTIDQLRPALAWTLHEHVTEPRPAWHEVGLELTPPPKYRRSYRRGVDELEVEPPEPPKPPTRALPTNIGYRKGSYHYAFKHRGERYGGWGYASVQEAAQAMNDKIRAAGLDKPLCEVGE